MTNEKVKTGGVMKSMKPMASCHVCKRCRVGRYSNCKCVHVRTRESRGSTNWS